MKFNQDLQPTSIFNDFSGRESLQLICDPFFHKLPLSQRQTVQADRAYGLLYLGRRAKGKWRFLAKTEGSGNDVFLTLDQFHKPPGKKVRIREKTLKLPLYLDDSSNSIHIDARNKDISELDLGVPPQLTDSDSDEGSEDDDMDDEVVVQEDPTEHDILDSLALIDSKGKIPPRRNTKARFPLLQDSVSVSARRHLMGEGDEVKVTKCLNMRVNDMGTTVVLDR